MKIEPIYRKIGHNVKVQLSRQGKSAEKLAYEIGLSKQLIYGFLAGKTRLSLTSLEKVAEGLDVSLKDLIP